MIKKIEMAKIVCLDGYVILHLEECVDGVLNIDISQYAKNIVRICLNNTDQGKRFLFWESLVEKSDRGKGER